MYNIRTKLATIAGALGMLVAFASGCGEDNTPPPAQSTEVSTPSVATVATLSENIKKVDGTTVSPPMLPQVSQNDRDISSYAAAVTAYVLNAAIKSGAVQSDASYNYVVYDGSTTVTDCIELGEGMWMRQMPFWCTQLGAIVFPAASMRSEGRGSYLPSVVQSMLGRNGELTVSYECALGLVGRQMTEQDPTILTMPTDMAVWSIQNNYERVAAFRTGTCPS